MAYLAKTLVLKVFFFWLYDEKILPHISKLIDSIRSVSLSTKGLTTLSVILKVNLKPLARKIDFTRCSNILTILLSFIASLKILTKPCVNSAITSFLLFPCCFASNTLILATTVERFAVFKFFVPILTSLPGLCIDCFTNNSGILLLKKSTSFF